MAVNDIGERAIVGAAINYPEAIAAANLRPRDFVNGDLGKCWRSILELYRKECDISPATIATEASLSRLEPLATECAVKHSDRAIEHYAQCIRSASVDREARRALAEVLGDSDLAGDELIAEAQRALSTIDIASQDTAGRAIQDGLADTFDEIDARYKGAGGPPGLSTEIREMDRVLGGLFPGVITVIAGRPSAGKSALCATIARMVSRAGRAVDYYSIEDTETSLHWRLLAQQSRVELKHIMDASMAADEYDKLLAAANALKAMPGRLYICDELPRSAGRLILAIERNALKRKTDLIVIDYFQLLRSGKPQRGQSRAEELAKISQQLAVVARRLRVPLLLAAQLNRHAAEEAPQLHHLKDCGSLEQDAYAVIMLEKPSRCDDSGEFIPATVAHVRKNKNGKTGEFILGWDGRFTLFSNPSADLMDRYKDGKRR